MFVSGRDPWVPSHTVRSRHLAREKVDTTSDGGSATISQIIVNPQQKREMLEKGAQNVENMHKAIAKRWAQLPSQAKVYLLETSKDSLNFGKLAKFWSNPFAVEYTRRIAGTNSYITSFFLSISYLKLGMLAEAKTLMLNGCFLLQCTDISIEKIVEMCGPDFKGIITREHVPLYFGGFHSMRSLKSMERYLRNEIPDDMNNIMTMFGCVSENDNLMNFCGKIADDWSGSSSSAHRKPPQKSPGDGLQIQIIVVDKSNDDRRESFNIGSGQTLRVLFEFYANKRGVSLRSLRFSYHGKTLFLSSVGNKTLEELNIRDQDVISVKDTTSQETSSGNHSKKNGLVHPQNSKRGRSLHRNALCKCQKNQINHEETFNTLDEQTLSLLREALH